MRYAIVTFGCRVNQADSLGLEEALRARGAEAAAPAVADVVIVNTCSVTASADQGARQTIRRIARENPAARIVATGCYATRLPSEVASLAPGVLVVDNDAKPSIAAELSAVPLPLVGGRPSGLAARGDGDGPCGAAIEPGVAGRTAFTLRVQTGCEERCSYCIIPSTRGAARSLPIGDVVSEIRRVAVSGFREVVLTGVHLGSYGRDSQPSESLTTLLRTLAGLAEDVTFRVSSLEPMDCTPEIVDLIATSGGRFAPHFHLPLQHASDAVLQRMRRPYTLAAYRRLVDGIRERLPHASIGSDMIVGFPGESAGEFAANLDYLPGSPLTHLHVFPYSDRPGTEATRMNGKVDAPLVRARAAELRGIGSALADRFQRSQVGTLRPGLALEDGTLVVTDNFLKLRIAKGHARNERVLVRVEGIGRGAVETAGPCGGYVRDPEAISIASLAPGAGCVGSVIN